MCVLINANPSIFLSPRLCFLQPSDVLLTIQIPNVFGIQTPIINLKSNILMGLVQEQSQKGKTHQTVHSVV